MISTFSMAMEIGAPLTKPMTGITNGSDRFALLRRPRPQVVSESNLISPTTRFPVTTK
jgi:hypothetical protein